MKETPKIQPPPTCSNPKCNALEVIDFMRSAFAEMRRGSYPANMVLGKVTICAPCTANLWAAFGSLFTEVAALQPKILDSFPS